jgi:crotonobetainyl-CoA:carnitine CoA-transferase CaiB-like acyl-CoA transferase
MSEALNGFRILDMALMGPGPFCTTILGDLGAEVIKIHDARPERRGGPAAFLFLDSPTFPGWRNCKAMGLNLKSEDGRSIFYKLASTADVIIEGFRPGVVKRMGVDYDTIKKIAPEIIYASITGYGQNGPYRDLVGHDINYISIGGFLGMTGLPGGPPVIPGTLVADFAAGGMSAAIGILSALLDRERNGRGRYLDVSVTDAMVGLMLPQIERYLNDGIVTQRGKTMATGQWPWYNVYETKDGKYISIGALEPWFYAELCKLLGREDFIEHQFSEGEKREEIFQYFRETFLTKTRDDWLQMLQQRDTCVAPVYSTDEVASDPHLVSRGVIAELDHPTMGRIKQIGPLIRLSESEFSVRNWCRVFGQHTKEIMHELGYDQASISRLYAEEVIG